LEYSIAIQRYWDCAENPFLSAKTKNARSGVLRFSHTDGGTEGREKANRTAGSRPEKARKFLLKKVLTKNGNVAIILNV